jgi:hypothetical protein
MPISSFMLNLFKYERGINMGCCGSCGGEAPKGTDKDKEKDKDKK